MGLMIFTDNEMSDMDSIIDWMKEAKDGDEPDEKMLEICKRLGIEVLGAKRINFKQATSHKHYKWNKIQITLCFAWGSKFISPMMQKIRYTNEFLLTYVFNQNPDALYITHYMRKK